jgi:hypothetical protein
MSELLLRIILRLDLSSFFLVCFAVEEDGMKVIGPLKDRGNNNHNLMTNSLQPEENDAVWFSSILVGEKKFIYCDFDIIWRQSFGFPSTHVCPCLGNAQVTLYFLWLFYYILNYPKKKKKTSINCICISICMHVKGGAQLPNESMP